MRQQRQKYGIPCYIAQVFFVGGALGLWIIAEYFKANIIGMVVSGLVLLSAGVTATILAEREVRKYYATRPQGTLPPYSIFASLGGYLIGLGLVGFLFVIIDNTWANTALVVTEACTLGVGLLLAGLGFRIEKVRKRQISQ